MIKLIIYGDTFEVYSSEELEIDVVDHGYCEDGCDEYPEDCHPKSYKMKSVVVQGE